MKTIYEIAIEAAAAHHEWLKSTFDPSKYEDGEVVAIDSDGCIIQYDAADKAFYNCGETPEEFGLDNLTVAEKTRLGLPLPSNPLLMQSDG